MKERKIKRKHQKLKVFLEFLKGIAELSESSRLKVGALALRRNFQSVFIGYNGTVSDAPINSETGTTEESLEPGKSGFIHAEMNLIAKFKEPDTENYVILLTHSPCSVCAKILINAGFKYIFWLNDYRETSHIEKYFPGRVLHYGNVKKLFEGDLILKVFDY